MSILLYHGTDPWRLREAVARAVNGWEASNDGRAVQLDSADPGAADELERILKYPSFFQHRSLVTLTDAAALEGLADLLDGSPGLADTDIILVQAMPERPPAAQKKALQRLERLADRAEEFAALAGAALAAWVRAFCEERGRAIEPAAVAELTARIGTDAWALANELEKLCAYEPATVSVAAVRTLVPMPPTLDEWELSNAIAAHDRRGAVRALYRRTQAGAPEQLLVGTVASAVRTLAMVRDLADRGRPASAIAAATGLHPYVVSKTLRGAAAYDPARLRSALRALAALDRDAKSGRADATDGLFSILASL